jgi:urease accessory protein
LITVTEIIGRASEERFAEPLHRLAHHGRLEYLTIAPQDCSRRRLRGRTDKGTDVAIALDAAARLLDGSIISLDAERAIVIRTTEQRWMRVAPADADAALALGYFIGNLHWRVRFEPGLVEVALDGPEEDYRDRLAPFLASGRAEVVGDA